MKGKVVWSKGRWIVSRDLDCGAEKAWHTIADTTLWPLWGPSVRSVDCQDRFIKADSCGRVRTALGLQVAFSVTGYEPGKYWSWRIGNIEATGHRVVALGEQKCRLEFDLPWWAAPYSLICVAALRNITNLLK